MDESKSTMLLTVLFILVLITGIVIMVLFLNTKSQSNIPTIWEPDNTFAPSESKQNKLGDYYFLGSYNSCCDGDFNGDPVKLTMLRKILSTGIRCIDFEVFSVKGDTCVSVSTSNDDFTRKGSFNEIPIINVCETIRYNAFSNEVTNRDDPLIVQFRIKSRHRRVYTDLANAIKKHFQGYLLGPKYAFNGKHLDNNIIHENINEFRKKIIIVIYEHSSNSIIQGSPLLEMTNILLTTNMYRSFDMETMYNTNKQRSIDQSKEEFKVVCPNGENTNNYDIRRPLNMGFHCCFINMHIDDSYYLEAMKIFNTYSVQLKPFELLLPTNTIKPDLSGISKGDGKGVVEEINILGTGYSIKSEAE